MEMNQVNTMVGDVTDKLTFHIISGRVHPIFGYSGLKMVGLGVDCGGDCLFGMDNKKVLFHAVKVKRAELRVDGKNLAVRVTQTKDTKGSRVIKKENILLIPVGILVVVGPKENKIVITAFKVHGTGIQSMVNVCSILGMHVSVSLRSSRGIRIQIFNATTEAKIISQKKSLAGVLMYPKTVVE